MSDAGYVPDDPIRGHEFDGIREFDNKLPNWWLWTFYLAIIFSVLYWVHFHVLGTGTLPRESYRQEMAVAAAQLEARVAEMDVTNESLRKLASEPSVVGKGQEVFVVNCATCHREDGGGSVGPNLTDQYWLHGAEPTDIYQTIVDGVENTAMVSWIAQLGPMRCQQVTAYLLSIKGTDVPNGKAPEKDAKKVPE